MWGRIILDCGEPLLPRLSEIGEDVVDRSVCIKVIQTLAKSGLNCFQSKLLPLAAVFVRPGTVHFLDSLLLLVEMFLRSGY